MDSPTGSANQVYDHPTRPHAITQHKTNGVVDKTYAYNADGDMTQRGSQYYKYDADNRLICAGSSSGSCDQAEYSYTVDGELYAVKIGSDNRLVLGGLYEWDYVTNTATAHIFALGREIAVRTSENATVREAWLPTTWPLPIGPGAFGWGLGALAGGALLGLLARAGALTALAERPVRTAGAFLLALTFLPPNAGAGGGPPQFGNGGNDWVRRWIVHDHLGNAILYTDASAAVVHRRVFEPFGMIAAETIPETEPTDRLFTGQRFEASAGVYNFRARWYDAETGRFLSVDPILQDVGDPQTHNAYGYVRNDPVNLVDPTGADFGISAIVVGIVLTLIKTYFSTLIVSQLTYSEAGTGQSGVQDDSAELDILLAESVVLREVNATPEGPGPNQSPEATAQADRVESQRNAGGAESGKDPNYVWDFGWIKILGGDPNVERQPHEGWSDALWFLPLSRLGRLLSIGGRAATATTAAGRTITLEGHVLQRAAERGISTGDIQATIRKGIEFLYRHEGLVKTGYYDPASKTFVGEIGGRATTVFKTGLRYIQKLMKTYP